MLKIKSSIFLLLLSILSFGANAQQKYALLVGINQYFDGPGIPRSSSLRGCVNDAESIRSLLIRRYGFSDGDIISLYDEKATKGNVVNGFNRVLEKTKPGDILVFYFSGHGVWMSNPMQNRTDRAIKKGMNQAMVMSDIYLPGLDCLFTDALFKRIMNKFIDKKVIPTTIFDCCFSGSIPASFTLESYNPYESLSLYKSDEKSLAVEDIFTVSADDEDNGRTKPGDSIPEGEKSFNLKSNLRINDSVSVPRPSERPNSMFLSLSATDEYEKGLDAPDETGTYHGVFTSALLHVINDSRTDLSAAEILRRTQKSMEQQHYDQHAMGYRDNARLSKNLIGLPLMQAYDLKTKSIAASGNKITLNAGALDGIVSGNIFSNNKASLKIISVTNDESAATVISGNAGNIKNSDQFIRSSNAAVVPPVVKLFVGGIDLTAEGFSSFFKKEITPLSLLPTYIDYEHWSKEYSLNLFFNDPLSGAGKTADGIRSAHKPDSFLVMLPVPSYITSPLQQLIRKNPNIQLVNNKADSDIDLYLNYVRKDKNKPAHFVLTWTKFWGTKVNIPGQLSFYREHISLPDLNMNAADTRALAVKLRDLLIPYIRMKSNRWLVNWDNKF